MAFVKAGRLKLERVEACCGREAVGVFASMNRPTHAREVQSQLSEILVGARGFEPPTPNPPVCLIQLEVVFSNCHTACLSTRPQPSTRRLSCGAVVNRAAMRLGPTDVHRWLKPALHRQHAGALLLLRFDETASFADFTEIGSA